MNPHIVFLLEPNRDVRRHIMQVVNSRAPERWRLVALEATNIGNVDAEVKIQRPVAAFVDAQLVLADNGAVGELLRDAGVEFSSYAHDWDVPYSIQLLKAGSRDMLRYPASEWEEFVVSINKLVERKTGIIAVIENTPTKRLPAGHLYVVHGSIDADVSAVVANAAAQLRTLFGSQSLSVAVVDLDLAYGDISVQMGLHECWDHRQGKFPVKGKNIQALAETYDQPWTYEQISQFMVEHGPSKVRVLASPFYMDRPHHSIPLEAICKNILQEVVYQHDITIVPCPQGPLELVLTLIEVASKSVHVITPTWSSLRFSGHFIEKLGKEGWPVTERVRVIMNKASSRVKGFSHEDIAEWFRGLKVPVLASLPHSLAALWASNDGIPFVLADPAEYGDQKESGEYERAITLLWESLLGLKLKSQKDRQLEQERAGSLLDRFDFLFKGNKDTHGGYTPAPLDPRVSRPF